MSVSPNRDLLRESRPETLAFPLPSIKPLPPNAPRGCRQPLGRHSQSRYHEAANDFVSHSVRLLPDTSALRTADTLDRFGGDAFGGDVPPFMLERNDSASPDGKHVYAAAQHELLIFERVGSR